MRIRLHHGLARLLRHAGRLHRDLSLLLDSEIATLLQETLKRTGIDLIASSQIERVSARPPFTLTLNSSRELKADAIVVAAGRSGNTESLKLENAGLTADARGFLSVNERFPGLPAT